MHYKGMEQPKGYTILNAEKSCFSSQYPPRHFHFLVLWNSIILLTDSYPTRWTNLLLCAYLNQLRQNLYLAKTKRCHLQYLPILQQNKKTQFFSAVCVLFLLNEIQLAKLPGWVTKDCKRSNITDSSAICKATRKRKFTWWPCGETKSHMYCFFFFFVAKMLCNRIFS